MERFDEEADATLSQPLMISVSGIRGIVGGALTPDIAVKFTLAYGTFLRQSRGTPAPVVLLGRDTRPSGAMLKNAAISGLLATGCRVVDLDICATPTLQLAIPHHGADGAIAITASHNPVEWNALKFFRPNGMYLNAQMGQELLNIYASDRFACNRWNSLGTVETNREAPARHIEKILCHVTPDTIRARKYRVVIDCCNGAGATVSIPLLEKLGCEVIPLHCELDGHFSRNPEPVAENLGELCDTVKSENADVGFAHDADVDRLSIVTDEGDAPGEELTLMLATEYALSHRKGPVVTNLSTTMGIDDIANAHGCKVIRTPIGDVNVSEKMKEVDAAIGGEGNGGVIIPEIQYARDAPAALALVLQLMAERGQSISAIAASLPQYVIVKRFLRRTREQAFPAISKLRSEALDCEIDERDGIKLIWSDHWVHIRSSGTEPIVRVIAEAKTREKAEALCEEFLAKF